MLSSSKIKHISSLKIAKYRTSHKQSIVEGTKVVHDLVKSDFPHEEVVATENWVKDNRQLADELGNKLVVCSQKTMQRLSAMKTPQGVLAVINIPQNINLLGSYKVTLFCDTVQDPGNMGTILRIADWFNIDQVVVTKDSADLFNPKVIQASTGAVFKVHAVVANLITVIENTVQKPTVYGAVMSGSDIRTITPEHPAIIALGNESTGLSQNNKELCDKKITIPRSKSNVETLPADSLNVAIAAALLCYHFNT